MIKRGKKYKNALQKVKPSVMYSVKDALQKVKDCAFAKFDESVDVDLNLSIDASKGEHATRGSVVLPFGQGKKVRVVVFAKGEHAEKATKAGADFVGAEDLIEKINGGWTDFDFAVATPDMMGAVGKVAKILGPRGLLPNQKLGTVTFEVARVVDELKKGRAFFKNDKSGIVHFSIGKVSFTSDHLQQNFTAFLRALMAVKPATAKGKFIKKTSISSTMGIGIGVDADEALRS